jgi:hypothetical protein
MNGDIQTLSPTLFFFFSLVVVDECVMLVAHNSVCVCVCVWSSGDEDRCVSLPPSLSLVIEEEEEVESVCGGGNPL